MSSFANLTKIPRIQKPALPAEQAHLVKSTKVAFSDTLLSCGDYRNIYSNLTVLFIGDNSIRTLFRDMCKSLKSGHLLDYMEASRQNGKYKTADGESILLQEGTIGNDNYRDIHHFTLSENGINLYYIFLSSINTENYARELHVLQEKNKSLRIDIVICCSFTSDINEKKITASHLSFDNYFDIYSNKLSSFLSYLTTFCSHLNQNSIDFYWMSPTPIYPLNESIEKKQEFEKKLLDIEIIIKANNFIKFNRYDIWLRRKDLVCNSNGYFSLHGIREIMDSFSRTVGYKRGRSFTPSIPMRAVPSFSQSITNVSSVANSSSGKWPKSTTNRPHPYYH